MQKPNRTLLKKNSKTKFLEKKKVASTLLLSSTKIEFSEDEHRLFNSNFDYICEENINSKCAEKNTFFQGDIKCWDAYRNNWDFIRDVYIQKDHYPDGKKCLKDRIKDELKTFDVDANKIIVISGMPGSGKSILGRRLAYDFYSIGKAPALFIHNSPPSVDYKVISTFIETINIQLEESISGKQGPNITKPIIIFDDASQFDRHIMRLKDWLQSRGRAALIIAIDRESEIASNSESFPKKATIDKELYYQINEELSDAESDRMIDHLYELGYLTAKNVYWKNLIKSTYENSFFATIYSLVHPSQKPALIIVWSINI